MAQTLFDVLTGSDFKSRPTAQRIGEDDLPLSIRDYLQRLLNARRGSLPHLPAYGLPDIAALFEDLPYSLDYLTLSVRQCIETFEARLTQVQVVALPAQPGSDRLRLEISGRTCCGRALKYLASFFSAGNASLELKPQGYYHG